ncbi:MAG TPA: sulfurtransferase TusA family protein, partial [Aggregatilineales bacterium]|nr:sulfurtransferase TusA family protein [Aggregatilineales bacterium]
EPADSFSTGLAVCSEVMLYLASRMHRLKPGEVLEFISTDPDAAKELIPWVEMRGYTLLDVQQLEDQQTRFLIRR